MKYLFQRKGSQNWHLRLQFHGELRKQVGFRVKEFSLGTPDRHEAELRAIPHIRNHKTFLLAEKYRRLGKIRREETPLYEPGQMHTLEDGKTYFATEDELIEVGNAKNRKPNGTTVCLVVPRTKEEVQDMAPYMPKPKAEGDDAFIRAWIAHRNINAHLQREAFGACTIFRQQVTTKPLKECDREDGRKLANILLDMGRRARRFRRR